MKVDLFGLTPKGYELHLEIQDSDTEETITSTLKLMLRADNWLKSAGCAARPVKSYGGGSGKQSAAPPDKCPECSSPVQIKPWTKEGKNFNIYQCSQDKEHFKPIFKLV